MRARRRMRSEARHCEEVPAYAGTTKQSHSSVIHEIVALPSVARDDKKGSVRTVSRSSETGFTILGVVVAVTKTVIVVEAIALLTVRTLSTGRTTKERIIATNLAREGIELVRSVRDDNWFSYPRNAQAMKWRGDLTPDPGDPPELTDRTAICVGTWIIDPELNRLLDINGVLVRPSDPPILSPALQQGRLFIAKRGDDKEFYLHDESGDPTIYRRTITIETGGTGAGDCGGLPIDGAYGAGPPPPLPDPVIVTSRVTTWKGKPTDPELNVEVRAVLYDWLRLHP